MSWKTKQHISKIQDVTQVSLFGFWTVSVGPSGECVLHPSLGPGFWHQRYWAQQDWHDLEERTALQATRAVYFHCCKPNPARPLQVQQALNNRPFIYSNGGFSKQLCLNNSNKSRVTAMIKCVIFQKRAQNNQQCLQHNWPPLSNQLPLSLSIKKTTKTHTHYDNWRLSFLRKTLHTEPCLLALHAVSDWTFPWRQNCKSKLAKQ